MNRPEKVLIEREARRCKGFARSGEEADEKLKDFLRMALYGGWERVRPFLPLPKSLVKM